MPSRRSVWLSAIALSAMLSIFGGSHSILAQAPSASPAAVSRAVGTVKAATATSLTVAPDNGQIVTVQVDDSVHIVQLTPGSTDLKTAQPITLKDVAIGDRVLVRGKTGDAAGSLAATSIIVMKQSDIQQKQEQDRLDWQKRGTGGLVSTVDPSANTITISITTAAGSSKLLINTTPKTVVRRYAADSTKFEDAKLSTLADVHMGDQLRVRGSRNADGTQMDAEEIVSGSFRNISGTIASVDAAKNTMMVKDLTSKKTLTVTVTPNSELHKLSAELAARFAARMNAGVAGTGSDAAGAARNRPAGAVAGVGEPAGRPTPGASAQRAPDGAQRATGMGLSQAISHTPTMPLTGLKPGDAVMIVATQGALPDSVTAITLLGGVEPILAATPKNSQPVMLSPWSIGGDMPAQ